MEWHTFGEVIVEGRRVYRPRIPLRYNDGNSFPPEAKSIQQVDFSDANSIIEAFYKNDIRAIAYEDNVRKLAKAVVKAISDAPDFRAEFPVHGPTTITPPPLKQPRL